MNLDAEPVQGMQELPPKIFLEVGTRYSPVLVVGNKRLGADQRYVGIDINLDDLKTAPSAADIVQPEAADRMLFINAAGRRLPLLGASVHEALLNNVLGDPKSFDRELIIRELYRVLASGGTLTVAEMYSPQYAEESSVTAMCQDAGFALRRLIVPRDENWKQESLLYGYIGSERPDTDAYIAEFLKP